MSTIQNSGTLISAWEIVVGFCFCFLEQHLEKNQQGYTVYIRGHVFVWECSHSQSSTFLHKFEFSCPLQYFIAILKKKNDLYKKLFQSKWYHIAPNFHIFLHVHHYVWCLTQQKKNKKKTSYLVFRYTVHIALFSFYKAYCSNKSLLYISE